MVIVKATKESEAGAMPDERTIADMGRFKAELVQAGVMQGGEVDGGRARFVTRT